MFEFFNPGRLVDNDLELLLIDEHQGDPSIGLVPAYHFVMVHSEEDAVFGRIDLRIGYTDVVVQYGGHIGYNVNAEHRGHHYAARSCRLLFPLAKRHNMQTLWITCNPDNFASRRTCEVAGLTLVEIVDIPAHLAMYRDGERQKCRYKIEL
jgi:tagatose 1,6-diphosphate aldolase